MLDFNSATGWCDWAFLFLHILHIIIHFDGPDNRFNCLHIVCSTHNHIDVKPNTIFLLFGIRLRASLFDYPLFSFLSRLLCPRLRASYTQIIEIRDTQLAPLAKMRKPHCTRCINIYLWFIAFGNFHMRWLKSSKKLATYFALNPLPLPQHECRYCAYFEEIVSFSTGKNCYRTFF